MEWAALIAWIATAGGGFVMLAIWLSRGGMRQSRDSGTRIRPPLILGHFLLAATGLVIWIVYVANDNDTLAWVAFALLAVVALLGFAMFGIWYQRRQRGPAAATGVTGSPGSSATPPEQHFPVAIVGLHGLLAVTTVVLVFLTAVGVGS
jgi:hypothetical protein